MDNTRVSIVQAMKRLYTELPTSFLGEPLELGVLRIAEISSIISLGCVVGLLVVLITGNGVAAPVIGLLLMCIQLACSLLLLFGVVNGRPRLMRPWFWLTVVCGFLIFFLSSLTMIAAPFLYYKLNAIIVSNFVIAVVLSAVMRHCAQAVYALMTSRSTDTDTETDLPYRSDHESTKGSGEYDLSMNIERD